MASELGPEPEARGSGQRRSSEAGGEGGGASTRPGYKSREGSPKASLHPAVARRGSSNLAPSTTTSICLGKESACNPGDTGDAGSIPGSGRSPGEGNGNSLRYSCLKNPMDREAWRATVVGSQRVGCNQEDLHASKVQKEKKDEKDFAAILTVQPHEGQLPSATASCYSRCSNKGLLPGRVRKGFL